MEGFMHRYIDCVARTAVRMGSKSLHSWARMLGSHSLSHAMASGKMSCWREAAAPSALNQREGSLCGWTLSSYLDPFWLYTAPPSRFPTMTRTLDPLFIWTLFPLGHIFMLYFCNFCFKFVISVSINFIANSSLTVLAGNVKVKWNGYSQPAQ